MRHRVASHENPPVVNWPRLQEMLGRAEADVVVATGPANVTYLSDFWSMGHWTRRSAQVFALAGRHPDRTVSLVLPLGSADLVPVEPERSYALIETYGQFAFADGSASGRTLEPEEDQLLGIVGNHDSDAEGSPIEALARAIEQLAAVDATVAFDFDGLQYGDLDRLHAILPDLRIINGGPLLRRTRAVKTNEEVRRLRTAAQISETSFASAVAASGEDDTEIDLQRRFHAELAGRDGVPFLTSITSGPRTALPNGQATTRRLGGDRIRFDGGCRYRHYASDISRMAASSEGSEKDRRYYGAVRAGIEAGVEAASKQGAVGSTIFWAAVNAVRRAGIPHYERAHCGHGIGIENYDEPRITPESDDRLEPGMVICLETPYYEIGWGGTQAEDTFLVTEHGLEAFTEVPADPLPAGNRRVAPHSELQEEKYGAS